MNSRPLLPSKRADAHRVGRAVGALGQLRRHDALGRRARFSARSPRCHALRVRPRTAISGGRELAAAPPRAAARRISSPCVVGADEVQLGQLAAPARQRRLALGRAAGLVLEVAERQVAHHRLGGVGDRLRVAPVGAQQERAAAHVEPDRAQGEAARVDRLLAVADEHQVAVVGGACRAPSAAAPASR